MKIALAFSASHTTDTNRFWRFVSDLGNLSGTTEEQELFIWNFLADLNENSNVFGGTDDDDADFVLYSYETHPRDIPTAVREARDEIIACGMTALSVTMGQYENEDAENEPMVYGAFDIENFTLDY